MAEITITVKDRTPELMQKVEAAIGRFVKKGITYIEGELKSSMAEPKSGKKYGDHIASAPGESPAVLTSNLTNSITMLFPHTLEGIVGTPVVYAGWLEDGTEKMEPRPLWEVTRNESLPTLEKMLDDELRGLGTATIGAL